MHHAGKYGRKKPHAFNGSDSRGVETCMEAVGEREGPRCILNKHVLLGKNFKTTNINTNTKS